MQLNKITKNVVDVIDISGFFICNFLLNRPNSNSKVAKIWASMMDGVSRCYNDWSELVTMTLSIISLEIARYARKRRLDYCPTSLFNVLLSKLFYFDNCRFFID